MSGAGDGRRAMIVTGEASGDLHGANLIRAASKVDPGLKFFGVGGRQMKEAGCELLLAGEDLAVMGLVEVLGHFPTIYRAFHRLKRVLHGEDRPDVLILIDFPDFNLRLARQAKKANIPVLYYVSPQVWAWRRGRVKKIAQVVDRLAAVFPFEAELYRGEDIDVQYVGHPLLDEAEISEERIAFRTRHGIGEETTLVGLFPGSRRNELQYIFDTIAAAAERIRDRRPEARFLMPVAPSIDAALLEERLAGRDLAVTLVEESIYDVANACDAVITVSGTVTLQTALVGTPMVILYKMAPLTYLIGRLLVRVPHIGLANIVAGRGVVRELVQERATPEAVAGEIDRILGDAAYAAQIREGLAGVRERMGEGGCSLRVARMASEMSQSETTKDANG